MVSCLSHMCMPIPLSGCDAVHGSLKVCTGEKAFTDLQASNADSVNWSVGCPICCRQLLSPRAQPLLTVLLKP